MKIFIVSSLSGILLPILLTIISAFFVWLFPQFNLDTSYINGVPVPGFIFAPIALPIYIYEILQLKMLHPIFNTFWFRFLSFFLFDYFFYFFLSFFFLSYLDSVKKRKIENIKSLPPPPETY